MKRALIVAHGQPSDPAPAAAEIAALAAKVATHLPGWQVRSVTLAEGLGDLSGQGGLVYPLFMAGGWFTKVHLPSRLAEAGGDWHVTEPFGTDPAIADLTVRIAAEAGKPVLLAAHGSFRSDAPSRIAHDMAARITAETGLPAQASFIDQDPRIADTRGLSGVCLPFFAARGGHVIEDLPAALARSGFDGPLLDPVGLHPEVPAIIAAALDRVQV